MPLGYISRWLIHLLLIMVGVSVLVFLMLRMIPGDPARLLLGEYASLDELARLRTQLGLDKTYLTQYAIYIKNLLVADFGKSVRTGAPIANEIGVRLLATIELSLAAMVIATFLGIAAGKAFFRGGNLGEIGKARLKQFRKEAQIIYQNSYSALNPRKQIGHLIEEPLLIHRVGTSRERRERVAT